MDCPITGEAGTVPESEEEEVNINDLNSYMSVHHSLHIRQKLYCERFSEHVVDYAIEWERIIVARVSTSLACADRLRRDLDHYKQKVDRMKMEKSKMIAQGRSLDAKFTERLSRNESKLAISRDEYELYANDLCTLIQEVTVRSWKDLHPILLKMTQFDATLASDEHQLLKNLNVVSNNLNKVAHRYGLKAETRLTDLETLSAKLIANGSGDNMMIEGVNNLSSSKESKSSSKENDDAVVRDVVNLLSKKTSGSGMITEMTPETTSTVPKSPRKKSPRVSTSGSGSPYSETDRALDNLMQHSSINGSRVPGSRSSSRNGSRPKSRTNNREFTGQPRQTNKQSFSRSGSGDRPPSRTKNRPTSRTRHSHSHHDDTFDDLHDAAPAPSTPRRHYTGSLGTPPKSSPSPRSYQQQNGPISDARAHPPSGNNDYRKKWSKELVSSVESEQPTQSSWYNSFF